MKPLNISLRQYRDDDVDAVHAAIEESKAELSTWMPWCHENYSLEDSVKWVTSRATAWDQNTEWSFLVLGPDELVLGGCGLHRIDLVNGVAEAGYWVRTSATRQGVASEATRQLATWAFQERNIFRIELLISTENLASQRAAEKAGATHEARLKKRFQIHGQRNDCNLYVLLKDESQSQPN